MTKIITDSEKINELLTRGVEEVIIRKELEEKLKSGKRLKIKWGVDPSWPDIHLGHSVILKKLKELQDMGHQVIFLIGDFTGMIGDPSGKSKTRPELSKETVINNYKSYFDQVGKILDMKKTEIRYNSEWYAHMNMEDILKLTSRFTIARILERDDFSKRFKNGIDIAVSEFIYPMMQAYDSLMLKADIEIGGNDQKFNMLAGRELAKKMGEPMQNVLILPLLVGLDGAQKMSKSLDNYIGVAENPNSMFGKIMSIPDSLILNYFTLLTDTPAAELKKIEENLKNPKLNPRDLKVQLAKEIIVFFHSIKEAEKAEQEFNKIFRDKGVPSEIEEKKVASGKIKIIDLLTTGLKLADSKGSAKILIEQGAVKIDNVVKKDWKEEIEPKNGMVVKVGKRKFAKIIL